MTIKRLIITAFIISTLILISFVVVDNIFKQDSIKGNLEELSYNMKVVEDEDYIISVENTDVIIILDMKNKRGFTLFDRTGQVFNDFNYNANGNIKANIASSGFNLNLYQYKYNKGNLFIGISETGSAIFISDNISTGLQVQQTTFISNIENVLEEYKATYASGIPNGQFPVLTSNLELGNINLNTFELSINNDKIQLPVAIKDLELQQRSFTRMLQDALAYSIIPNQERSPKYSIALSSNILLLIYDNSIKIYDTALQTYKVIDDSIKLDYNGKVEIK